MKFILLVFLIFAGFQILLAEGRENSSSISRFSGFEKSELTEDSTCIDENCDDTNDDACVLFSLHKLYSFSNSHRLKLNFTSSPLFEADILKPPITEFN